MGKWGEKNFGGLEHRNEKSLLGGSTENKDKWLYAIGAFQSLSDKKTQIPGPGNGPLSVLQVELYVKKTGEFHDEYKILDQYI